MNINSKYLYLLVLVILLLCIPVAFAADNNDTQLQDMDLVTTHDSTVTKINNNQQTINTDKSVEVNNKTSSDFIKTTKNNKADELKTTHFRDTEDITLCKNENFVLSLYVLDDEDNYVYRGNVIEKYDNSTYNCSPCDYDDWFTQPVGEHEIHLYYEDDSGVYAPCETSYKLTVLDVNRVLISSRIPNFIINTDENININFSLFSGDDYEEKVSTGNITFNLKINDNYIPIKTVDVNDQELNIAMDTILSKYSNINQSLNVTAVLEYNDTTGIYKNESDEMNFTIYAISNNVITISDVYGDVDELLNIPISIKDEYGNNVTSYSIISPNVITLNDSILFSYYNNQGSPTLNWIFKFDDNTLGFSNSTVIIEETNRTATDFLLHGGLSTTLTSDETITARFIIVNDETGDEVTVGNVTLFIKENNEYIPIKTVDVNEKELTVDLESLISKIDNIHYPYHVDAFLLYTDNTGQYCNMSDEYDTIIYEDFIIYDISNNTLEVADTTAYIGYYAEIPIKFKNSEGEYITPEWYSSYVPMYSYVIINGSYISIFKNNNNIVSIKHDLTEEGNYTLYWTIRLYDESYVKATSQLSVIHNAKSNYTIEINDSIIYKDAYEAMSYDVQIPIIIKDEQDNIIKPEINNIFINCPENNYNETVYSYRIYENEEGYYIYLNSDNFSLGNYSLNWTFFFKDSYAETKTNISVIMTPPRTTFVNDYYNYTTYLNQHTQDIYLDVHDQHYNYIYEGKVTVKVDDTEVETIYLSDTTVYTINLDDLINGEHIIALTYEDENGLHPSNQTTITLNKTNISDVRIYAYPDSRVILSSDDSLQINFNIYDKYTIEDVTVGNVTLILYKDDREIPLKTVDVNEGKIIVNLEDILSNIDSSDYPLYVYAYLFYNDSSGQYANTTSDISLNIYNESRNNVYIPYFEEYIGNELQVPITITDENGDEITEYTVKSVYCIETDENLQFCNDGYYTYYFEEGTYTLTWTIEFYDNTYKLINSTIKLTKKPLETKLVSYDQFVYQNQETIETAIYLRDENSQIINNGIITIKLDDDIVNILDLSNYNSYMEYNISTGNLDIGEYTVTIIYEDESGKHPNNQTTYTLTKLDTRYTQIIYELPPALTTDETVTLTINVIDYYSKENITEGTVNVYQGWNYNNLIKTFNMTDEKNITINILPIVANYTGSDYPITQSYHIEYINPTDKYTPDSTYSDLHIYKPSEYLVEIPELNIKRGGEIKIPIFAKDNEGNNVNSEISYVNGHCLENECSIICNGEGILMYVSSDYYYDILTEGTYTFNWEIMFTDDTSTFTTSNITITSDKESFITQFDDIVVFSDTSEYILYWDTYNQDYQQISGNVSIYLDDEYVDVKEPFDYYYIIPVNDLSYGQHSIRLVYVDNSGTYPTCESTVNLIKLDLLETDIDYELPYKISTQEDTFTLFFNVTSHNGIVEEGNVSVYVYNDNEEYFITSVSADSHNITLNTDQIISLVNIEYYPILIKFKLIYEDNTQTYGSYTLILDEWFTDKKVAILKYIEGFTIENGNTIFYYDLKDNEGNPITQGTVELLGYLDYDYSNTFEGISNASDGKILINNLDLSKNPGIYIDFTLTYNDENNIYAGTGCTIGLPNTFDIDIIAEDAIGKVNEYIAIPVKVIDEYQNEVTGGSINYYYDEFDLEDYYYNQTSQTIYIKFQSEGQKELQIMFIPNDYNAYKYKSIKLNINVYSEEAVKSKIQLTDITTTTNTPTTITAKVYDEQDNLINEGKVTFLDKQGNILGESTVKNGTAIITYTFTDDITTQITAYYTSKSNSIMESKNTSTLTVKELKYILKLDDITATIGKTINLSAKILIDNQTITEINKGKVVFKVNGKTIKDANGKVIYAKVVNGVATIENFIVPESWDKDNLTIEAVYSGSIQCDALRSDKQIITITKEPVFTTEDITTTINGTIILKATITDNDKVINTGKVIFKINGKTVKDTNDKVIYAKIENNTVSVEYTLPESYKAKEYTLTATFISPYYDRLSDEKTLKITE